MRDAWIEREWNDLCRRVRRSAEHYAAQATHLREVFHQQAESFAQQQPPDRYPAFLDRVRSAADLAKSWCAQCKRPETDIDIVDEALLESFPASDPPCWTTAAI